MPIVRFLFKWPCIFITVVHTVIYLCFKYTMKKLNAICIIIQQTKAQIFKTNAILVKQTPSCCPIYSLLYIIINTRCWCHVFKNEMPHSLIYRPFTCPNTSAILRNLHIHKTHVRIKLTTHIYTRINV